MPRKNLSQNEFVTIFNSSDSYDEIMARTGLTPASILNKARLLRKAGIELKRFPIQRRLGVIGWLKDKYPQVYQDLKENYPDIYSAYYTKVVP